MNKKGMTWGTIVYAIIALIVLITLVWFFRDQINEIYKGFTNIIQGTTAGTEELGDQIKELTQ
jgi:hypothetical protein